MAEHPPFPSSGEPAPGPLDHSGSAAVPGADGGHDNHAESLTSDTDQATTDQPAPADTGAQGQTQPQGQAQGQSQGPAADEPSSTPPRSQQDDDAAFLELVARFDDEPTARTWPAQEDIADLRHPTIIILRPPFAPDVPDEPDEPDSQTAPGTGRAPLPPGLRPHHLRGDDADEIVVIDLGADGIDGIDGTGGIGADQSDDDEHYVPPPPPPLPRVRPVTRWALGSIALGMVFLVVPSLIGFNQSRSQDVAGVLFILGGVGTLVARMGERPPTDLDGPGNGAVL
ncbi:hypothetical protein [Frankia sp. R82]|uniref:hypothetical protein n=1 Tax=Frankia sp. R82 TaxID=2950553 RepID=UPI00204437C3|nr:hypothetical protein [Frankia sp. R82]MCM3885750.1 hypothetical protein [Frankia sp. R82]